MSWHLVAHRSELANPGDYVCLPWAVDAEIALTNIGGRLVAFDNRCSHRGAKIFTELRGNREPRCAYHGRLATPETVSNIAMWKVGDWVLAKPLNSASADLHIGDMLGATPELVPHSILSFTMDCDWTVAVENALDLEHVEHVHAGSLAKLGLISAGLMQLPGGSSIEAFRAEAGLGKLSKFFPQEQPFDYVHAHLYPNSCLSSTRGWTYSLQNYFPRADGRTTFVHRLYTAPTTRPMPEFFNSVAKLNERVFREDAAVCALVQPGHTGKLAPREARIAHFRSQL